MNNSGQVPSFAELHLKTLGQRGICTHRIAKALFLAVFICGSLSAPAQAQSGEWTWISGSNINSRSGNYGVMMTPATGNTPGARQGAMGWTDKNGDLWLFGGWGIDANGKNGYLNDLWMFSPATKEWAWMSGSNAVPSQCGTNPACGQSGAYSTLQVVSAGNVPGGRYGGVTWTDANGYLWLFGGYGYDSAGNYGYLNDLWKFDPSVYQWEWVSGSNIIPDTGGTAGVYGTLGLASSSNTPGARLYALSWTDSNGNLWLFGGSGYDSAGIWGSLNDLWQFNPATGEWTWMGGSSSNNQSGAYGSLGTPSVVNNPGARFGGVSWTDDNGNLWLFGGDGADSTGDFGDLNDVWKFNPSSVMWTWMGGSNVTPYAPGYVSLGTPGVYGTQGMPSPENIPGSRVNPVGWTDASGNLWLFGGQGYGKDDNGTYNDLWVSNPIDSEWAWMDGSDTTAGSSTGPEGIYGTEGVAASSNVPGGRYDAVTWTDSKGDLWLFGGWGYDSNEVESYLNDLWEYTPSSPAFPASFSLSVDPGLVSVAPDNNGASRNASVSINPTGGFNSVVSLAASGQPSGVSISFNPSTLTGAGTSAMTIDVSSTAALGSYPITVTGTSGNIAQSTVFTLIVSGTAEPVLNPAPGNYATSQTVTISDATPGASIYYTTNDTPPSTSSSLYTGPITVPSSETIAALAVASGYPNSQVAVGEYTIGTPSSVGAWTWMGGYSGGSEIGTYGKLDGPEYGNIPGSRSGAASWTDLNNNLWLFGGYGLDSAGNPGYLNDMWRYIPGSKQWAWMGGSTTVPCTISNGVKSCSGQPGVYGTQGVPASGNIPGGRNGAAHWIDSSGQLWFFGGYGLDINGQLGELNDLWEFDPVADEWTWVGGSSAEAVTPGNYGQPGVYGTLGVPAPGNIPGGRYDAAAWTDSQGNFWLFGGTGKDSIGDDVVLNDLWEFSPSTKEWTWMGGSSYVDLLSGYVDGVYGTKGVPAPGNIPGSRSGAATWTDSSGNLWLFGGDGGPEGVNGQFNDLWKFDPTKNEWAWMSGSNNAYCPSDPLQGGYGVCTAVPGVYGTLGVPAAGNIPPGGSGFASWTDSAGNLWLFGGTASDITGQNGGFYTGIINDLWVFNPSSGQWAWMGGDYAASNCSFLFFAPAFTVCDGSQGNFGTLQVPGAQNNPPARTAPASWVDKTGNFWLFSGAVTNLSDLPGYRNDLWEYQPSTTTLPAATKPILSLKPGTYTSGGPLSISNGMAGATIYYTTDGTIPTVGSTAYSGSLTMSPSETVNAIAVAPGYRASAVSSVTYSYPPTPPAPTFSVASGSYSSEQIVTISDMAPAIRIFYTTDGSTPSSSSNVYSVPITVSSSETIKAVAVALGYFVFDGIAADYGPYVVGPVASATYSIDLAPAATPTFSLPAGTYSSAQAVTITDATQGAVIYYTSDGSMPTTSSTVYSGSISVSQATTLKAIAVASGYAPSAVATAVYTFAQVVMSATSPSAVSPGGSTTSTLTLNAGSTYSGTINLACQLTSSPTGAQSLPTCSISPNSVTLAAGGEATATLTIKTVAGGTTSLLHPFGNSIRWLGGDGAMLAVGLLFGIPAKRRRSRSYFALAVVSLLVGAAVVGCAGGGQSSSSTSQTTTPATTVGSYTFTVTGTDSANTSITASTVVTMSVQ